MKIAMCGMRRVLFANSFPITGVRRTFAFFGEPEDKS
jgi:hypothetical protein